MSARFCPQCKSELPAGVADGLCDRCRQSLARHGTIGPEPTTAAGPASPDTPAADDPAADEGDVHARFWAAVADLRRLVDERQALHDRWAVDLDKLRRSVAEREADPDATPWDLEELRKEIGETEALLADMRRSLDEYREEQRRDEEKHGRSAIRELLAERLPQLEIWGLIGRGGMGEVWKARHKQLGRDDAIKVLPPEIGREPGFAERFRQEARALAHLSHPNIVSVHDYGEIGGLYFFIMEYLPLDLRWWLANGVTAERVEKPNVRVYLILDTFMPICDAVAYAHEQGVLHRDIKPENILTAAGAGAKLADFGLVRLLQPGAARLTGPGQAVGTFPYMAPEQLERPAQADHRADVYALGVVLYEMLTGRLPRGHFDPPSKACGDERLDPVVLKALAPDPAQRYQSAEQLKTDLEKLQQAGAFWREQKKSRQDAATLNDLTWFIGWALLPLALAVYTVAESRQVLPWWLVAAVPCLPDLLIVHRWKSPGLRAATFVTWFCLLPGYVILGQALGWEPVFGRTLWTGVILVNLMVLAWTETYEWPDKLKTANGLRELRGLPPLRPFQLPWTRLPRPAGCLLWAVAAGVALVAPSVLPEKITYWLPTAVTLWVTVNVGAVAIQRAWVSDRLPELPEG
jgi:hypothetical protein